MRHFHLSSALIAVLLLCPEVTHANVTPVPDLLAQQCRQLESAHGPTLEFPNTFYTNLVFQCSTRPGTAPAGVVYKTIEQYGKALANNDARPGSVCEVTQADGGANVLSQGPMHPTEASAANDVVVSYNAKYACLTPKHTAAFSSSRYAPRPLMAAVPMGDGYGYYEETRSSFTTDVSYTPPRPSWVERDEAYNRRHAQKAVYRNAKPVRHAHRTRKGATHASARPAQKVKIEVKTTTTVTPAPAPKPSSMLHAPAPTSPLPGFVSP